MGTEDGEGIDWVRPDAISVGWLSPETPPGLFCATETGGELLWLAPTGNVIRIGGDAAAFCAFQLNEDSYAYAGVHLGAVELELDTASIATDPLRPVPGDILIRSGTMLLVSQSERPGLGLGRVPIGRVATAERFPYTLVCKRWSLVREADDRIELFRRDIAAEA